MSAGIKGGVTSLACAACGADMVCSEHGLSLPCDMCVAEGVESSLMCNRCGGTVSRKISESERLEMLDKVANPQTAKFNTLLRQAETGDATAQHAAALIRLCACLALVALARKRRSDGTRIILNKRDTPPDTSGKPEKPSDKPEKPGDKPEKSGDKPVETKSTGTFFTTVANVLALLLTAGVLWYFADMARGYFAGHQPDPVVVEQPVNAKQESPQDTTSQPDTIPVTITDAPVFDPPIPDRETANRGGSDSASAASPSNRQSSMNMPEVQGWLGVETHPQVLELVSPIGINSVQRGMIINNIVKGGPADIAGMVVGDLLVSVDNKAVDTDDATRYVMSNIPVGRTVPIKIIRDGRVMYLLLTITQRPQP